MWVGIRLSVLAALAGMVYGLPIASAGAVRTSRVSVTSQEKQVNAGSSAARITPNGRFILFASYAGGLVPGDRRGWDLFVRDRRRGTTRLVSKHVRRGAKPGGTEGDAGISASGRYVAFSSLDPRLVPGDTNREYDVFVRDMRRRTTRRISLSYRGRQLKTSSHGVSMSASGRYVAFSTAAARLVRGDTNGATDVFVYDRRRARTTRVSLDSRGRQANRRSWTADIAGNGRHVAFWSRASDLVPGDTNRRADVFVHDRATGATTRVSVGSDGQEARPAPLPSGPEPPSISADGRYVAFASKAANLVREDTNRRQDIFVRDRTAATTRRVSVSSGGGEVCAAREPEPNPFCNRQPAISPDGRFVAFTSAGSDVVPDDTNVSADIFVHDTATTVTTRVSVATTGRQACEMPPPEGPCSGHPAISEAGRFVAFDSLAPDLVAGDTNHASDVFVRGPLVPSVLMR